ncbi:MAG: hypothetical protein IJT36_07915 [Alphaproteobacteria bacterium]|nr:hypothetical protein [Alphaproteobacteria bacterium]
MEAVYQPIVFIGKAKDLSGFLAEMIEKLQKEEKKDVNRKREKADYLCNIRV